VRESYLLRMATDPPVRIWSGARTLPVPAGASDPVDAGGATYRGWGELLNLPAVQQLINGAAERLDFSVSGISAEALGLAAASSTEIREKEVRVGSVLLDDYWQVAGDIAWEWVGTADSLIVERDASGEAPIRTITLSVRSGATDRRRPPLAFFTDQDQRRRSSDDAMFDHIAGINAGTTARFGPS
jgi:hypothetical protein